MGWNAGSVTGTTERGGGRHANRWVDRSREGGMGRRQTAALACGRGRGRHIRAGQSGAAGTIDVETPGVRRVTEPTPRGGAPGGRTLRVHQGDDSVPVGAETGGAGHTPEAMFALEVRVASGWRRERSDRRGAAGVGRRTGSDGLAGSAVRVRWGAPRRTEWDHLSALRTPSTWAETRQGSGPGKRPAPPCR